MKLLVTTPVAVIVDADDVTHVRAEDETGAFGILPGHADFVTVLTVSVVSWRNGSGTEHHIVVRGGVLLVREGTTVEIVTREAAGEDSLPKLVSTLLAQMREQAQSEATTRVSTARLHLAVMRQLQQYLGTRHGSLQPGGQVRPPRIIPDGGSGRVAGD